MEFLKLTQTTGNIVYINIDAIKALTPHPHEDITAILLTDDSDSACFVKESIDEILKRLPHYTIF